MPLLIVEHMLLGRIEDPDCRADLFATTDVDQPVGFINVLGTWVDQVGVVPPYRGQRLGPTCRARPLQARHRGHTRMLAHRERGQPGRPAVPVTGLRGGWQTGPVRRRTLRSILIQPVKPQGEAASNPPQPVRRAPLRDPAAVGSPGP
jgi:hypothetical protein